MRIPGYDRSQGLAGMLGGRGLIILAIIVGLVFWWFTNQKQGITGRSQMLTSSIEDENRMGLEAYMQILSEEPVMCSRGATSCAMDDTREVERIRAIGRRLQEAAAAWEAEGAAMSVEGKTEGSLPSWGALTNTFNWQFNVIDADTPNAFALPGGFVAIYSGILPVAANDDGLAAVMSHEIGHALARHGGERMSQGQIMSFGQLAIGLAVGDMGYDTQRMVMGAFGLGAELGVLKPFSRAHESEADIIGLELLVRACFDPREAPRLWRRMAELGDGARPPEFLSTHPDPEARAAVFEKLMPTAIAAYEKHCGRKLT
ncbi:MAG: peptidase M48 Ste24p [Alphaproteobacteria bacterium 32-64-14]|nr:MAG: peptidase M48 Ste24p [Alphaproteobacteria bacterium 32-64-14]